MTNEQYEKYKEIEKEIKPVKDFLFWSGMRYKNKTITGFYKFSIKRIKMNFSLYIHRYFCSIPENTYELPIELQNRIIEVIEKYVDEKEQEMANI